MSVNLNVQTTKLLNYIQSLEKWKRKKCPSTFRYGLLSMRLEMSIVGVVRVWAHIYINLHSKICVLYSDVLIPLLVTKIRESSER